MTDYSKLEERIFAYMTLQSDKIGEIAVSPITNEEQRQEVLKRFEESLTDMQAFHNSLMEGIPRGHDLRFDGYPYDEGAEASGC